LPKTETLELYVAMPRLIHVKSNLIHAGSGSCQSYSCRDWLMSSLVRAGSGLCQKIIHAGTGPRQIWFMPKLISVTSGSCRNWFMSNLGHTGTGSCQIWFMPEPVHVKSGGERERFCFASALALERNPASALALEKTPCPRKKSWFGIPTHFVAAALPKSPICALKLGDRTTLPGVARGFFAGFRHA